MGYVYKIESPNRMSLNQDLLYDNLNDWYAAPCYAKIHTHPNTGKQERRDFINKVVDTLNQCIQSLSLMKEPGVERNIRVVDKIRLSVLPLYKELIVKHCGKVNEELRNKYIRYLLGLGANIRYYTSPINQITGKKTIPYLTNKLMVSLNDALYSDEQISREEMRSTGDLSRLESSPSHPDDPYPGFDDRTFIDGGKVRSAKRHPRRKSSTTKRRPRRKSSAIKHRHRRTSRK